MNNEFEYRTKLCRRIKLETFTEERRATVIYVSKPFIQMTLFSKFAILKISFVKLHRKK